MNFLTAVLALLASGCQDDIETARKELQDRSYGNYWDRLDTCRELGRLDTLKAAELLSTVLDDAEESIREASVISLARMKSPEVRKWLREACPKLKEDDRRANLLWAFRRMRDTEAVPVAIAALADRVPVVRAQAARFLAQMPSSSACDALDRVLSDQKNEVREQALWAYARCKGEEALSRLESLRKDATPRIRSAALILSAEVSKGKLDVGALEAATSDKAIEPRIGALEAAGICGADAGIRIATPLINDREWPVRAAAVEAIEESWDKRGVELLVGRLPKEDGRLRLDIVMALERMTGKSIGFDAKAWTAWWDANRESFTMPPKPQKGQRAAPGGETRASFMNIPLLSKRIVFVIDFSGSMKNEDEIYKGKRKIDVAFEELEKAIKGLSDDVRINVIALSTEATARKKRKILPTLTPMTAANRKKVIEATRAAWRELEDIKRGRGDIYDAVVEGFDDPETDTVVLLSDGKPTYGKYLDRDHIEEALKEIHRYRRATVHTVLTGSKGIDPATMQAISSATRGLHMPRSKE